MNAQCGSALSDNLEIEAARNLGIVLTSVLPVITESNILLLTLLTTLQ